MTSTPSQPLPPHAEPVTSGDSAGTPSAFPRGRAARLTMFAIVIVVNLIVLRNAIEHKSLVGYDVPDHISYAQTLAEGRLPGPKDTREFFSAPLPYVIPTVASWIFDDPGRVARVWQAANVIFSVLLCLAVAQLVTATVPSDGWGQWAPAVAVGVLGTLPVYYKTFAQARGEPLLAWLVVLAIIVAVQLCRRPSARLRLWVGFGLLLGLLALTRQWGVLAAIPLAVIVTLVALAKAAPRVAVGRLAVAASVALLICGWFYLSLYVRFGSATAFNQEPRSFALSNHPPEAYLDWPLETMLTRPIRPNLTYRFGPILYSDFWGDYWGYFRVYTKSDRGRLLSGRNIQPERWESHQVVEGNYAAMSRYLGRVNAVSVLPTFVLLAALVWGGVSGAALLIRGRSGEAAAAAARVLAAGVVIGTFVGYFWFVVSYADEKADEVKASYVLQAVPCLVYLTAALLASLARRWPRMAGAILLLLGVVAIHNALGFWSAFA